MAYNGYPAAPNGRGNGQGRNYQQQRPRDPSYNAVSGQIGQ